MLAAGLVDCLLSVLSTSQDNAFLCALATATYRNFLESKHELPSTAPFQSKAFAQPFRSSQRADPRARRSSIFPQLHA